jgi:hypothetical protein
VISSGVSLRTDRCGTDGRILIRMYSHSAEIVSETPLHCIPHRSVKLLTGRAQNVFDDSRQHSVTAVVELGTIPRQSLHCAVSGLPLQSKHWKIVIDSPRHRRL